MPPDPGTVELVRVPLLPGAELAAGVLERGAAGGIGNLGRTPMVVEVLTLFPHAGAGTLMP